MSEQKQSCINCSTHLVKMKFKDLSLVKYTVYVTCQDNLMDTLNFSFFATESYDVLLIQKINLQSCLLKGIFYCLSS